MSQNKKYVFYSALLHGFILLLLVLGLDFSTPMPVLENTYTKNAINAVVLGDVAQSKIMPVKAPAPVKTAEENVEKPKAKIQPPIETKPDAIALKIEPPKKKKDEKALAEKKKRELMEKELLADMQKMKKQSELKKKEAQKKIKSQFEKVLREQAEKSLRQQLLNEEIKLQGAKTAAAQGVVDKYKALILQAISTHWMIPAHADKSLSSQLLIRLAPGGMVLAVELMKSSGDPALDSSARAAVLKASPLPVPEDPTSFEPFRQFVLTVKPENILASEGSSE